MSQQPEYSSWKPSREATLSIFRRFCLRQFGWMKLATVTILLLVITTTIPVFGQTPAAKSPLLSRRITFEEAQRLVTGEDEGNMAIQQRRFSRTRLRSGQVVELYYPMIVVNLGPKNGRASVAGYGILYPSEAAFHETTRPRHMLEELIPDGAAFLAAVPELIARLEKRLHLATGRLEYSRAGLRRLDIWLRGYHSSHTTAETDPRLFQELTAYYGETLRRARNGQWRIHEERVDATHRQAEPNLVFGGVELKPWSEVIQALYDEDNRGTGLTKAFDGNLQSIRLP